MNISGESVTIQEFENTLMKNNHEKEITKEYLDNAINFISKFSIPRKEGYISHLNSIRNQIGSMRDEENLSNAYKWYKKQEELHNKDYWKIFPELNDIF